MFVTSLVLPLLPCVWLWKCHRYGEHSRKATQMALVCPAFFLNRLGKLQRRAFTYIQQLFLLVHNALCLCKDIALACPMKFLEKTPLDFLDFCQTQHWVKWCVSCCFPIYTGSIIYDNKKKFLAKIVGELNRMNANTYIENIYSHFFQVLNNVCL